MAMSKEDAKFPPGILVAAAIDLGTTFSGYAFAFRNDKYRIYASTWHSMTTANMVAYKAPTTVLLQPDGTFDTFGFEAEEQYSKLIEENNHHGWFYLQNFKMELYRQQKLSRQTKLKDIEGKEISAMKVFTIVIQYLRNKLIEEVRRSNTGIEDHEIFWILTVPAIWSDAAKQFMREAATKAGITNTQLKLVLEPEAASVFGQANYTHRDVQAGGITELIHFRPGQKYIVADLGGGTADIATHEQLEDGNLREIFRATGDELGGNRVNLAFLTFLENLVGKEVMDNFKNTARSDYLDFVREFEMKKGRIRKNQPMSMILKCPPSFSESLLLKQGITLHECIRKTGFSNVVEEKRGRLTLTHELVNVFFREPVDEIITKLREIIHSEKFDINTLLMVGGFSDSPYVRESVIGELHADFPGLEIVNPEQASLHVLKGAVLTISKPKHITERISRYSYGFRVAEPFNAQVHPAKLKEKRQSGEEYCSDIFYKCIEVGQCLRYGDTIKREFSGKRIDFKSKEEPCSTELYRTAKADPKYCTADEGCERVGQMIHHPPREGWGNIVMFTAEIEIGETEFKISVVNATTQEILETTVDFLDD